jgi:hypothetical protein
MVNLLPASAAVALLLVFAVIWTSQDHSPLSSAVYAPGTTQTAGSVATTTPAQTSVTQIPGGSTRTTAQVTTTTTPTSQTITTVSTSVSMTVSPTTSSQTTTSTAPTPTTTSTTTSTSSSSKSTSTTTTTTTTSTSSSGQTTTTTSTTTTSSTTTSAPVLLAPVNLGTAGNYVILSKSGISTTGTTSVTGNLGVSPIGSTAVTGFGLTMDSSGVFATSSLVTGKIYAANYAVPTPTSMTTAVSDMQTAYTDAAGRTNPTATELGAGDISGMTLSPGLYKWGTSLSINTGVTLNCQGNANAVFIFQIAQTLTVGSGAIVTLSGGCQASNIFWQVGGQTTLGTTSNFKGVILCQTAIVLNTGASLTGRALAQTAVTLNANSVTSA